MKEINENIAEECLLNSIPLGICIIDSDYTVTAWNDTISEWTSIESKEITGKKLYKYFPKFKDDQYRMRLDNIFSGGPPVILSSQFHKNIFHSKSNSDYERHYHITASAFCSELNLNSLLFTLKDVTDTERLIHKYRDLKNKALDEVEKRKKAEEALLDANKSLEIQANTDLLTQLYNRRKFSEIINSEMNRVNRSTSSFSIIFLDIDNFKIFNTVYGHDCGDYVLKQTALYLKESIRVTDTVSRWGGEEFVILLPETDIEQALILTEKLRSGIEKKVFNFNKKELSITVTFGLSMYKKNKDTLYSVINRADDALRTGKKEGKNRVIYKH